MKDDKDNLTVDMIKRLPGRPVINPDFGPLSDKERQARSRAGRKVLQVLLDEKSKEKLMRYCKRHNIKHHQLFTNVIKQLKITKPDFLE